jgi:hypothetical protein
LNPVQRQVFISWKRNETSKAPVQIKQRYCKLPPLKSANPNTTQSLNWSIYHRGPPKLPQWQSQVLIQFSKGSPARGPLPESCMINNRLYALS